MINDDIKFEKVRLIDAEGQMVGVVTIEEARKAAEDAELDLVLISANPDNPVCRIQDYGKFLFEQSKKDKEQKKKQKQTEVKEVGLNTHTSMKTYAGFGATNPDELITTDVDNSFGLNVNAAPQTLNAHLGNFRIGINFHF